MYYFDPNKVRKAYDLLKDCKDFIEAKNDVNQIDMIINSNYNLWNKLIYNNTIISYAKNIMKLMNFKF